MSLDVRAIAHNAPFTVDGYKGVFEFKKDQLYQNGKPKGSDYVALQSERITELFQKVSGKLVRVGEAKFLPVIAHKMRNVYVNGTLQARSAVPVYLYPKGYSDPNVVARPRGLSASTAKAQSSEDVFLTAPQRKPVIKEVRDRLNPNLIHRFRNGKLEASYFEKPPVIS